MSAALVEFLRSTTQQVTRPVENRATGSLAEVRTVPDMAQSQVRNGHQANDVAGRPERSVDVPAEHRTVLVAAAKGARQEAMAHALAAGEAIRPSDFYDKGTRYDQARRSLGSLRKRAEAKGVLISPGPWGPRGGVRWQYNPAANEALSTTAS